MESSKTLQEFNSITDISERFSHMQSFIKNDFAVALRTVPDAIQKISLSATNLCKLLNMSYTQYTETLKKGKILMTRKYVILCDYVLKTSIHKFLFSVQPQMPLTKKEKLFWKYLSKFKPTNIQAYIEKMPAPVNSTTAMSSEFIEKLAYERLLTFCDDHGVSPLFAIDNNEIPTLKKKMKKWVVDKGYVGDIPNLVYIALCLNVPVDYFLILDYSPYCDLYFLDNSGDKIYLTNSDKKLISHFMCLSPEQQDDILSDLAVNELSKK